MDMNMARDSVIVTIDSPRSQLIHPIPSLCVQYGVLHADERLRINFGK